MNSTTTAKNTLAAASKGDAIFWEDQFGATYRGIFHGIDTTGRYALIWTGGAQAILHRLANLHAVRTSARDLVSA